jgi:MYXO-CTERM domain-containing protein
MTRTPRYLLATSLLALASACTQRADVGSFEVTSNSGPAELDVLFVVDNSGSMAEEQASLASNFQVLIDQLEGAPGTLPSVHVGVISTDLGAGGYPISTCDGDGDAGAFQSAATDGTCTPPTGPFISDEILDDGSRERNYTGTLADTFSCIARLGIQGCGFEQPLESIRRALDSADGADFLRDDAYLAVVILTDEDDCSTSDTTLFDIDQMDINDPLGPLSSFRCVEFGVTCDGGPIGRSPASYADCQPDGASAYLFDPDDYVDYLTALKGDDADKLIVSVIAGDRDAGLTVVDDGNGNPSSQETCSSAAGLAYGGYRLGYFADQFPNSLFTSICNPDLTGALQSTARLITDSMGDPNATDPSDPNDPSDPDDPDAGCSAGAGGGSGLLLVLLGLALIGRRRR